MSSILAAGGGTGAASGRLINVRYFMSAQTTTYTPSAGTNAIVFQMVGAGGGGGGASGNPGANVYYWGQPGAAGAFLQKYLTTNFSAKQIVVGSAGPGGAAGNHSGTAGGNTTFDAGGANYIASGGSGGPSGRTDSTYADSPITVAATASGGDINLTGDLGGTTVMLGLAATYPNAGATGVGGSGPFGKGGLAQSITGTTGSAVGVTATGNGAGGSGGITLGATIAAVAGGTGTDGACVIYEYS